MPKKKQKTFKIDTIPVGLKVVDAKNTPFVVQKIFYSKKHKGSNLLSPTALNLKNTKTKKQQKISLAVFYRKYKIFNPSSFHSEDEEANTTGIGFYSEKPVVPENEAFLKSLIVKEQSSPLAPIIEAIKKQIQNESKTKRDSDLTLMFDAIHNHYNGFIARRGFFSDTVVSLIIRIDWMGNPEKFNDYKKENLEESATYNLVVFNTQNKLKTFVIRLLRRIIIKYPKYKFNGGK
jgi:hypothetical protein